MTNKSLIITDDFNTKLIKKINNNFTTDEV